MKFIADLHIHSRFSRATAKNLTLSSLYLAARIKGITVLATGDCTHPEWFAELREQLEPAEPGLFKLKEEFAGTCEKQIPFLPSAPVRFILNTEISNIYKKTGVTRKNHNLVFFPDMAAVARFNAKLARIGNITSDGRPILGLDARDLLELMLETSDAGFLVPAHVWTPWFSLFGSKSGFDDIKECFEDLTPHVFALETGLSSDPAMNWRVGNIDGHTLISNSDAHSPANLGREANLLNTELSYHAIKAALQTGDPETFLGTIEFFPEEGKYHNDGHRNCGVNLSPHDAMAANGLCPVCGKPLTLGVLHRVTELATRPEGGRPPKTHPFYRTIPLSEIVGEIAGAGGKSKKAGALYDAAIRELGPELLILNELPISALARAAIPFLAEAVSRMREGRVHVIPGHDGEYGRVTVFAPGEKDRLSGQKSLFQMPGNNSPKRTAVRPPRPLEPPISKTPPDTAAENPLPLWDKDILSGLNPRQREAVIHAKGPMVITAGPGTGKTRTLTCRIAWLIKQQAVDPASILAVTFTRKAAGEMSRRLSEMLGPDAPLPLTVTFHALCLRFLHETAKAGPPGGSGGTPFSIIDEADRRDMTAMILKSQPQGTPGSSLTLDQALDGVIRAKQLLLGPMDDLTPAANGLPLKALKNVYAAYQNRMSQLGLRDYEDLIIETVGLLESGHPSAAFWRGRFPFVFVDEYQDLNHGQHRIIRALAPPDGNLCVIGDPDQSIYGFRGSSPHYFVRFEEEYPRPARLHLTRNYRSTETILEAAHEVIRNHAFNPEASRLHSGITGGPPIHLMETLSETAEAVAVGKTIARLVGGTGFHFDDFGEDEDALHGNYRAFSDIAVLYRTRRQGEIVAGVFEAAGLPFQMARKDLLFHQKGVRELIAALKKSGTGETGTTDTAIPVRDRISALAVRPDIREKLAENVNTGDALERLLLLSEPFGRDLAGFLEILALETDPDMHNDKAQKLSLMTFHAAKGLEFPVVFIIGCENGYVPFFREKETEADVDEERRLFYVAMTRAREALYLTWANHRTLYGRRRPRQLSPFVAGIPEHLLSRTRRQAVKKPKSQVQLNLF